MPGAGLGPVAGIGADDEVDAVRDAEMAQVRPGDGGVVHGRHAERQAAVRAIGASNAPQVADGLGRIAARVGKVAQHNLQDIDPAVDLRGRRTTRRRSPRWSPTAAGCRRQTRPCHIVALPCEQRRRHATAPPPSRSAEFSGDTAIGRDPGWPGSRSASRPCRTGCPAARVRSRLGLTSLSGCRASCDCAADHCGRKPRPRASTTHHGRHRAGDESMAPHADRMTVVLGLRHYSVPPPCWRRISPRRPAWLPSDRPR